jgi:hypothetical protein
MQVSVRLTRHFAQRVIVRMSFSRCAHLLLPRKTPRSQRHSLSASACLVRHASGVRGRQEMSSRRKCPEVAETIYDPSADPVPPAIRLHWLYSRIGVVGSNLRDHSRLVGLWSGRDALGYPRRIHRRGGSILIPDDTAGGPAQLDALCGPQSSVRGALLVQGSGKLHGSSVARQRRGDRNARSHAGARGCGVADSGRVAEDIRRYKRCRLSLRTSSAMSLARSAIRSRLASFLYARVESTVRRF